MGLSYVQGTFEAPDIHRFCLDRRRFARFFADNRRSYELADQAVSYAGSSMAVAQRAALDSDLALVLAKNPIAEPMGLPRPQWGLGCGALLELAAARAASQRCIFGTSLCRFSNLPRNSSRNPEAGHPQSGDRTNLVVV